MLLTVCIIRFMSLFIRNKQNATSQHPEMVQGPQTLRLAA